jgi:HPt (histidine-containing phosphotransfer) domain-containing protein
LSPRREERIVVMDFRKMAEGLGLGYQEFLDMLDLFVSTVRHDLEKLREALGTEHFPGIAAAAHSITGASSNLGFTEIAEVAKGVELNARGETLGGARAAISLIDGRLREIDDNLKQRERIGGA